MTKLWAVAGILVILCGLWSIPRQDPLAMECLTYSVGVDRPLAITACREAVLPTKSYHSIWTDVVGKSPELPLGHINLAREYHLSGNRVAAQAHYQIAMDAASKRHDARSRDMLVRAQSNLSVLMIEAGEYDMAERVLRATLSLVNNDGLAVTFLAIVLNHQQRYGESIAAIDEALAAGFGPGFSSFAGPLYVQKALALCAMSRVQAANLQFDYAATHFADIEHGECKPQEGF